MDSLSHFVLERGFTLQEYDALGLPREWLTLSEISSLGFF